MNLFNRLLNPQFTDLALFVGPDVRWTEEDYRDIQSEYPEVLLGYRVRLTTMANLEWDLRGRRVQKVVLSDECRNLPRFWQIWNILPLYGGDLGFVKVEMWHIHRGEGIWRVW